MGEFLHLATLKEMISYYFASGHFNYAMEATIYVMEMDGFKGDTKTRFLQGPTFHCMTLLRHLELHLQ